jgi:DNA uptake protein ComE-like DNA-binding protein
MNSLRRFFSEWFGYSRRERRASMILVIIIGVVILVRYLIPEKGIEIEVNALMPELPAAEEVKIRRVRADQDSLFSFDPNNASFSDLTSLGVPGKVAGTLIRYRNNGGRFKRPEDIMKVYGMDSVLAGTLIPYINIKEPDTISVKKVVIHIPASVNDSPVSVLVDINRCDSAGLEALPGIGPVLSARIIRYRELLGGYVSAMQLKEVYGIQDSVYLLISGMVIIDTSAVRKINVNSAGFRELEKHPYLERYDVQAIIKYREIRGKIEGMDELKTNNILNSEKAGKILPYLLFN